MNNAALTALSPLDGRYAARLGPLRDLLSEAAFMRFRVQVEMAWLVALSDAGLPELAPFSADSRRFLAEMLDSFGTEQAARIKQRASQVRDEARIEDIVQRVRRAAANDGGDSDVIEQIYRSMMEAYIAHEHREFARLRQTVTQEG